MPTKEVDGKESHFFPFLSIVRFPLAIWVVLHHLLDDGFVVWQVFPNLVKGFIFSGTFAVGVFFVISGFVITQSLLQSSSLKSFYTKRIRYLFPLFLLTTIIAYMNNPIDRKYILRNLLGLNVLQFNSSWFTLNGPAWSVSLELFFYLSSPLWIPLISRIAIKRSALAICLSVSVGLPLIMKSFISYELLFHAFYHGPIGNFLAFTSGSLLFHIRREDGMASLIQPKLTIGILCTLLLFSFYFFKQVYPWTMFGGLGYFAGVLIVASSPSDSANAETSILKRLLIRCGEASFVIYITQWMYLGLLRETLTANSSFLTFFFLISFELVVLVFLCYLIQIGLVLPIANFGIRALFKPNPKRAFLGLASILIMIGLSIHQPKYFDPIEEIERTDIDSYYIDSKVESGYATFSIVNQSSDSIYIHKCQFFIEELSPQTQMERMRKFVVSVESYVSGYAKVYFDYRLAESELLAIEKRPESVTIYCY